MSSTVGNASIAVVGASGHTGRFVVAELERQQLKTVPIGRRSASIDDPASLDRAIEGCAAVINCAGPFLDTALPFVEAAIRAGIPYLDIAAEQAAVQVVQTRDAEARSAGVALVPAAAFYGGLADLLAKAAAGDAKDVDDVTIAVALDSWHPTKGTRVTGARNTAPRLIVRGGELQQVPQPLPDGSWTFPGPFGEQNVSMLPFSETITIFNHLKANTIESWINHTALRDVRDATTPAPQPIDERGRSSQRWVMDVVVRTGQETTRATASGQDIYAVTAPIVVTAVRQLLARRSAIAGVRSLGEIVDAREFLDTLVRDGSLGVEYQSTTGATPSTCASQKSNDARACCSNIPSPVTISRSS